MSRLRWLIALAALAGPATVLAEAPPAKAPPKIALQDFASLPVMRRPLISPDGRRIVARSTAGGKERLVIFSADDLKARPTVIPLGDTNVAKIRWAGNQRLLLTIQATQNWEGEEISYLRLLAIDTATGAPQIMDRKSRGIYAGDVLYTDPTGSWALVASQDDIWSYPSVKRVDLATGEATQVEKERDRVWDWYADDKGVVRAGIAYEGRRWIVWYRDKAEEKLRPIRGKLARDEDSAVDRIIFGRGDNSWIITNEKTGRFALYKYDLKAGEVGQAIFEHPEVDIDDVTYDALTGEIKAIEYEDDRQRIEWLDPELKKLQARLDKALPGAINVTVDWSDDDKRALVWSGSASDPGVYYLLDRSKSTMNPVMTPYPAIDPAQLSAVKMVRYQARDGLTLPAYLTLPQGREAKNLPLIVLPHGGPFLRDEWDYDPLVQFLANRGYAVLQPQFRGSTGFGKEFVTRGYGEWGRKMQDDLDDGVDWLAKTGQIDPKRVCIVGASYGGYAAMWGAIRNPERYRCAASFAGVSDVPAMLKFDRKLFSATRYHREWRNKVSGEGKVDLSAVSPVTQAARLKVPLFIAHGDKDENVPAKQSRRMVEALNKTGSTVTSVFYPEGGHGFDNSADYEDWLRRLEEFLAKHNPA
ncbi:MAG: S9 family peptidase [Pseudomonadota bacterium]|nr:S9 family peptidase [Pseudomonadota bacterium]